MSPDGYDNLYIPSRLKTRKSSKLLQYFVSLCQSLCNTINGNFYLDTDSMREVNSLRSSVRVLRLDACEGNIQVLILPSSVRELPTETFESTLLTIVVEERERESGKKRERSERKSERPLKYSLRQSGTGLGLSLTRLVVTFNNLNHVMSNFYYSFFSLYPFYREIVRDIFGRKEN